MTPIITQFSSTQTIAKIQELRQVDPRLSWERAKVLAQWMASSQTDKDWVESFKKYVNV